MTPDMQPMPKAIAAYLRGYDDCLRHYRTLVEAAPCEHYALEAATWSGIRLELDTFAQDDSPSDVDLAREDLERLVTAAKTAHNAHPDVRADAAVELANTARAIVLNSRPRHTADLLLIAAQLLARHYADSEPV